MWCKGGPSHGDDGSYVVHTGYEHAQLSKEDSQEEGNGGLPPEPHSPKYLEVRDEVVIGDGLEDTWGTGEEVKVGMGEKCEGGDG